MATKMPGKTKNHCSKKFESSYTGEKNDRRLK
jgi:hypothetical protein